MEEELPSFFQYEPIPHPKQQIRLLRIRDADQDEELDVELTTHYLNGAPEFRAISYTWGCDDCCPLLINDKTWWTRNNGYYALWQARLHWPETYIWIDAICINQDDLQGKAAQVPLMEHVYAQATCVLACVGPHADSSQLLLDVVPRIEAAGRSRDLSRVYQWFRDHYPGQPRYDKFNWDHWLTGVLGWDYVSEMRVALTSFAQRPYWTRLWCVQEIAAASRYVVVLCGEDRIIWDDVDRISQLTGGIGVQIDPLFTDLLPQILWNERDQMSLPRTIPVHMLSLHYTSLEGAVAQSKDYDCTDVRDSIYGILSLVRWTKEPIIPDYSKSCLELAADTIPHLDSLEGLPMILSRLKVHCAQPDMLSLLLTNDERSEDQRSMWVNQQPEIEAAPSLIRCARIITRRDGTLTAAMEKTQHHITSGRETPERKFAQMVSARCKAQTTWELEGREKVYKCILVGGWLAAMVCGAAEAEDILVPIQDHLLVLRQNSENDDTMDVIGQGFPMPDWQMWEDDKYPHGSEVRSGLTARLALTVTPADCLRLIGQDFVNAKRYDHHARMQRLVTVGIAKPEGAARLYDVTI